MTIDEYLDKLAAKSPVPGGGSAAALVGAIGISLLSMVARYTEKRAGGRTLSSEISEISRFAERSSRRLRKLMTEDERAYLMLWRQLKRKDSSGLSKLYKGATAPPLEICTILQEGMKKCEALSGYSSKSLASDLAEAALLMKAGFSSAKLHVNINLGGISDSAYTKGVRKSLSGLTKRIRVSKWQP